MKGATVDQALRAPRARLIAETLERRRREHPQLRAGNVAAVLEEVAALDGIRVHRDRLRGLLGMALTVFGCSAVTVASDVDGLPYVHVLAHELAHVWLGHTTDPILCAWRLEESRSHAHLERGPVYERTEDEADLFAAQLLGLTMAEYLAPITAAVDAPSLANAA